MYTKNEKLMKLIEKKKVLIVSHRGSCGGNLCQNTHLTFKAALLQGADILELDVIKSVDGVFYAYHSNQDQRILHLQGNIHDLTSKQIDELEIYNWLDEQSGLHLERLDDVLDEFENKCFINIDRSWVYMDEMLAYLKSRKHDSIILKTPVKDEYLEKLEKSNLDVMYMPIAYNLRELERCMDYEINLSAVEMIFRDLNLDLVQPEVFELCEKLNLATFVNAETLGKKDRFVLSAGFDDNLSIEKGFEYVKSDSLSVNDHAAENGYTRNVYTCDSIVHKDFYEKETSVAKYEIVVYVGIQTRTYLNPRQQDFMYGYSVEVRTYYKKE